MKGPLSKYWASRQVMCVINFPVSNSFFAVNALCFFPAQLRIRVSKSNALPRFGQDDLLAPMKLERLSKEHVVDLSVGRRSCVALTFHGDLFGWGYHQHNQLGFLLETTGAGLTDKAQEQALEAYANHKTKIKYVPTMVRADTECPLANVSVGTDSTLAADRDGRLMVWGDSNRRVRPDQVAKSDLVQMDAYLLSVHPSYLFPTILTDYHISFVSALIYIPSK